MTMPKRIPWDSLLPSTDLFLLLFLHDQVLHCTSQLGGADGHYRSALNPDWICYHGHHADYGVTALVGLCFYILTSTVIGIRFKQDESQTIDIRYPPIFRFVIQVTQIVLSGVSIFVSYSHQDVALGFLFACCIVLGISTMFYESIFYRSSRSRIGFFRRGACCVESVSIVRGYGYFAVSWIAVCVLEQIHSNSGDINKRNHMIAAGVAILSSAMIVHLGLVNWQETKQSNIIPTNEVLDQFHALL
jgi:hypothetical protein